MIGVISDTHGYVDPQLAQIFAGVEAILHAGDIGTPAVLAELARIAPVFAVRGNVDRDPALLALPERLDLAFSTEAVAEAGTVDPTTQSAADEGHGTPGGVHAHLVHQLPRAVPPPQTQILVFGHSHRAVAEWRGSILYLNPGAAGRQGFHRLRTVAVLSLDGPPRSELIVLGPRTRR